MGSVKKNILNLLFIFIISFALIACNITNNFSLNEELIDNNLNGDEYIAPRSSITVSNLTEGYTFDDNDPNIKYGLMHVENELGEKSVWSFLKARLLFAFDSDVVINIRKTAQDFVYVENVYLDGSLEVFDALGNVLIPQGKYNAYKVRTDYIQESDILRNLEAGYYILTISYTKNDEPETNIFYKIDYLTGATEKIDSYNRFGSDVKKYDLTPYGLEGYFGYTFFDKFYIFDKNDKHIITHNLSDISRKWIADGKIIYQNEHLVPGDSEDYTYIVYPTQPLATEPTKYKVISRQLDLLTGKEVTLDLDYVFESVKPFKNEKGKVVYGFGAIRKIENKKLTSSTLGVILNTDGKILAELPYTNFENIYKLDNGYFHSVNSIILDHNLIPKFRVANYDRMLQSENLIVTKINGFFGAIDGNGNIVIPHRYEMLGDEFVDGKLFAKESATKSYVIDKEGNKELIGEEGSSTELITNGLIYNEYFDVASNKIIGKFLDFNLNNKYTINHIVNNLNSPKSISNIYGEYKLIKLIDQDSITFVLVDVSRRKLI